MNYSRACSWFPTVLTVAAMSKDPSRKVGCVLFGPEGEIRSSGRNGLPRGIDETPAIRHQKPDKLRWYMHAEENAIAQAARSGASTNGCTAIVSTLHPCAKCAGLMVQAGIIKIYSLAPDLSDPTWGEDAIRAQDIMREGGITWYELHPSDINPIAGE